MLKKLQNLLFEDEDEEVNDEEEEEVEEKPEPKRRKQQSASRPSQEPVRERTEQPAPQPAVMQRIDVTQPIQQVNEPQRPVTPAVPQQPTYNQPQSGYGRNVTVPHASPRPLEEKPSTLGLTVDQVKGTPAAVKPVEKPAPARKKEPVKPKEPAYEFRPVISPMFGVDEKDMDAMQVTANSAKTGNTHDENVSQVISPIYGISREAEPSNIQMTVKKSNEMESMSYSKETKKVEDDIPSFSLDDILNSRDDEYAETADQNIPDQTADVDETVVMDTRGLTPFGKVNPPKKDTKDQK